MKFERFGQATPLDAKSFRRILDGFLRDDHKLFWTLCWYTGERPGAILQMKVEQCYEDAGRRRVRSQILFPASSRKDRKTREVPLARNLELALKAYAAPVTGYLFPSPYKPDQHITARAIDKAFRRAIARAGLVGQGYSLYSARRGFITELHRAGYDVRVIQALTGHSSLSMLARYIDVSPEQQRLAIDSLG